MALVVFRMGIEEHNEFSSELRGTPGGTPVRFASIGGFQLKLSDGCWICFLSDHSCNIPDYLRRYVDRIHFDEIIAVSSMGLRAPGFYKRGTSTAELTVRESRMHIVLQGRSMRSMRKLLEEIKRGTILPVWDYMSPQVEPADAGS